MSKMKKAKSISRPKPDNSRKTLRKQKRQQKKVHRQEHYLKKKNDFVKPEYTPGRFVKRPADAEQTVVEVKKKKPNPQPSAQDILSRQRLKEIKEANTLKSQMEEQRRQILLQANEEEDKMIKKLEKQLGLNKSKNKNNYFADDGLDYLLEICDKKTTEQIVAAEKHLAEVEGDSDFEQDLAAVTGKDISEDVKSKRKQEKYDSESDDETNQILGNDSESDDFNDDSDEQSEDDVSDDNESNEASDDSDGPEEKPTFSKKSPKSKEIKLEKDKILKEAASKDKKGDKSKQSKEKIIKADDLSKVFSDDEVSHLSDDGDLEELSGDESDDEDKGDVAVENETKAKPDIWEDIYGRKRDKEGNVIKETKGVYVPPHLRNKDNSADDKQMQLLKRQIKSVLNKLTGTNLHWACSSIETLYASNSRNAVNTALTQLWLDGTVAAAHTPDRMLTEHAALLAVLHANVAAEIGAHFLQELCKRFDEMTRDLPSAPMGDKRLDNLVACLAHLYSFKIYHASLLYDILYRLLSAVTEKSIDCIVTVLRCAGGVLRKAEPGLLRTFILRAQSDALIHQTNTGSRVKFLLEVLMAVKNNNLTKIPNYEPSYQEELRKATRAIVRKGNYITTLNISLEDLLKADERGKWWVVGSAWEGSAARPDEADSGIAKPAAYDQKLLELARKQRMNTDVRRSIFCVIMSAQDYMDAFEKLQHLGLKTQQEREVVHVLLACCLQERSHNPYYAVLAQKLCDTHRKYQLSIQFSVWDRLKELEQQPRHALSNLAHFLVHLLMQKGLPLSVLKVIQFSDLNKHSVRFMRQVLLSIIMNEDLTAALDVFHRVSRAPKLHLFRESVVLFIQHFLVKNAGKKSNVLSGEEMEVLKERANEVTGVLKMYDSKLKF